MTQRGNLVPNNTPKITPIVHDGTKKGKSRKIFYQEKGESKKDNKKGEWITLMGFPEKNLFSGLISRL